MRKHLYLYLFILAGLFLFVECTPLKRLKYFQNKKDEEKSVLMTKYKVYTLKPGDMLFIRVIGLDDKTDKYFNLSLQDNSVSINSTLFSYPVNDSGFISLPIVGDLKVVGLTIDETSKKVNNEMRQYISDATVIVKMMNFKVSVLGEVAKPGYYLVSDPSVSLFEMIANAGEINPNGNRKKVHLIRSFDDGKTEIHYLDLTERSIIESDYYYLYPGDIIYVEPLRAKQFATNPMPIGTIISIVTSALSTTILLINYLK